jgi:pyruvate-formate lyase-activating enzyme
MSDMLARLAAGKFSDPDVTARGERRAAVTLAGLRTLWFNTGTLCNLACENCYIESSPRNDRLAYLSRQEVRDFLAEARTRHPELVEIGFTGGEPFLNPDFLAMLEDALAGGWRVLVLTNAMRPMQRLKSPFLALQRRFPGELIVRVSLDHYTPERHEAVRGPRSWASSLAGLQWLAVEGFDLAVATRLMWGEGEVETRRGFAALFREQGLPIDAENPARLVLFPEMDAAVDVPEITESCWGILGKSPQSVMCASSRMVVKHRGASSPSVIACTLLPFEPEFDLGGTLAEAARPVKLNHPHCARFCVLGGASCSG